jgi:hypothetical protein
MLLVKQLSVALDSLIMTAIGQILSVVLYLDITFGEEYLMILTKKYTFYSVAKRRSNGYLLHNARLKTLACV